jgi:hypothetical protein
MLEMGGAIKFIEVDGFGNNITDVFRKAWRYTIKTETGLMTESVICRCFPEEGIKVFIGANAEGPKD